MTISEGLKRIRKENGLTQQKLVTEVGLVHKTYQQYEQGKTDPPAAVIAKLADYYHVSIDYVVGRSSCKTVDNEYIHQKTGLSDETITKLHDTHTWDKWITSHTYDEQHKIIDALNLIFEKDRADLLYNIYEYIHSDNIVMPDTVSVFDDSGTGHTLPAASLYRSVRLHDITKCLDEITHC